MPSLFLFVAARGDVWALELEARFFSLWDKQKVKFMHVPQLPHVSSCCLEGLRHMEPVHRWLGPRVSFTPTHIP